jgi:hypothetical protein
MLASPGESQRARRRTAKVVNYAKEQEFSDASDVFEDSDDSAPKAKSRRGRPRKSDANESGYTQDDDMFKISKPVYTERGYDPGLLPIRERFPFLPEYEPDGSPRIDIIIGRRPIDEKEDHNENGKEGNEDEKKEEGDSSNDDDEEETGKQRTRRAGKRNARTTSSSPSKKDSQGPVEYEYLIKYKGRSYLHLEWKTGADLESMNKSAKNMYRRYLKKIGSGDEELEDPNFDPSYAIPQRIIDEAQQEITVDLSDKELLKWEKERAKELAAEESDSDSDKAAVETKKESTGVASKEVEGDGKIESGVVENPAEDEGKKSSKSNIRALSVPSILHAKFPNFFPMKETGRTRILISRPFHLIVFES